MIIDKSFLFAYAYYSLIHQTMQIFNIDYNKKMRLIFFLTFFLSCSVFGPKTTISSVEKVAFTQINSLSLAARIDTGATSSTLHAEQMTTEIINGITSVNFYVRDDANNRLGPFSGNVIDEVKVKSSNSRISRRKVIELEVLVGGKKLSARFTLFDRSKMTYRVLLGRDILQAGNFLIRP